MNAVLAYVNASDLRVSGRVRGWMPPRWIRLWMLWATRLGDGWLWLAAGLVLWRAGRFHRIWPPPRSPGGPTSRSGLKRRRRRRPGEDTLAGPPGAFGLRGTGSQTDSPSSGTDERLRAATVMASRSPPPRPRRRRRSAAASQVILGLHYLSDVVAGSLLGVSSASRLTPLVRGWRSHPPSRAGGRAAARAVSAAAGRPFSGRRLRDAPAEHLPRRWRGARRRDAPHHSPPRLVSRINSEFTAASCSRHALRLTGGRMVSSVGLREARDGPGGTEGRS
jgi:undecaprenyl-diphosphatase